MVDSVTKAYMGTVVLFEELNSKEEYDADRMKESGRDYYVEWFHKQHPKAEELFKNYQDGHTKFRARMPISFDEKATDPHPAVTSFLTHHGYEFSNDDYKNGVAHSTKVVGDPERGIPFTTKKTAHKIGGLLDKHAASDDLKKSYVNDPYRIGAKTKQFDMIITANHRDIYGGSTGRGWTSCADKRPRPHDHPLGYYNGDGPASRLLKEEINNHTHMVYLVPHGADLDKAAIGRISFKKYKGLVTGHETLIPEPREYGTPPKEFQSAATKVMGMLFERKPNEVYQKNDEVYHDGSDKILFPDVNHVTGEQMDVALKAMPKKDAWARATLHKYIDPNQKYKTHEPRDIAKAMKNFGDTVDGKHSKEEPHNVFQHSLAAAQHLDSIPERTGMHLVENPHVKDMIERAAKHFDIARSDHVASVINLRHPNDVTRSLINHVTNGLAARNYTEFKHISSLRERGYYSGDNRQKVPLADKHQMGRDPFDHIIRAASDAGELDSIMLSRAYHTAANKTRRSGNIFDHAIHYEREGVPGMSKALDDYAAARVKTAGKGGWGGMTLHDDLASTLYRTKPANRERLASAFNIGMDHKQIMKAGKNGIAKEKELDQMIRDATKQKLEEGFVIYDDMIE